MSQSIPNPYRNRDANKTVTQSATKKKIDANNTSTSKYPKHGKKKLMHSPSAAINRTMMHSPSMGLVTKVTQVSSKEDKMFVKNFSQQYLPDLNLNTAGGAISSH